MINNVLLIGANIVEVPTNVASLKASIKSTFASEIEINYIKRIKHLRMESYF
jgi:hypothetical protein